MSKCSIKDCGGDHLARGYCGKHYQRWKKHGSASVVLEERHGLCGTPEHRAWKSMMSRCFNKKHPAFYRYGKRGITVCKRWLKFKIFFSDMGIRPSKNHSLERVNNSRGYSPANCKWATSREQNNNMRTNRMVVLNKKRMTMAQAASELGIRQDTARMRLERGCPIDMPMRWSPMNAEIVKKIRRYYTGGRGQCRVLGEKYGVSRDVIWQIVNRKTWRHI